MNVQKYVRQLIHFGTTQQLLLTDCNAEQLSMPYLVDHTMDISMVSANLQNCVLGARKKGDSQPHE